MNEIWKDVIGYEGLYQVSNTGKVRSIERTFTMENRWGSKIEMQVKAKELVISKYKNYGYTYCSLCKEGKAKKFKMHRLIAIHFIDNPENYPFINHINAIRDDNRIENLEWCTHSHNMKHKFKMGNQKHTGVDNPASKIVFHPETGIFYDSIQEVLDIFKIKRNSLGYSLNGVTKKDYGFIFA